MSSDRLPSRGGSRSTPPPPPPPPGGPRASNRPPPSGLRGQAREAVERGREALEGFTEQGQEAAKQLRGVPEGVRAAAEEALDRGRTGGATQQGQARQRAREAKQLGREVARQAIDQTEVGTSQLGAAAADRKAARQERTDDEARDVRTREAARLRSQLRQPGQLRRAVLTREIIGPPVSLRDHEEGAPGLQ